MCKISKGYIVTIKGNDDEPDIEKEFMTTNEAAEYLKLSPQTIRNLSIGKSGKVLSKKYSIKKMNVRIVKVPQYCV